MGSRLSNQYYLSNYQSYPFIKLICVKVISKGGVTIRMFKLPHILKMWPIISYILEEYRRGEEYSKERLNPLRSNGITMATASLYIYPDTETLECR